MVDDCRGILSHFRRANLKTSPNHGGRLQGHSQPFQKDKSQNFPPTMVFDYRAILSHFRMANLKFFFNHGGLLQDHSQPFQKGKSQNFLQPWWTFTVKFSVISEGQISKFSPTKVDDYRGILIHFRRANLNFSPTMVNDYLRVIRFPDSE